MIRCRFEGLSSMALLLGLLSGAFLGLAGAWIGLTIQHCGNHGAMSPTPWVNKLLGLTDDLIGGSSLMWRYHHQAGREGC
jgi:fatty acid desaturase (delta-4 desaturase)